MSAVVDQMNALLNDETVAEIMVDGPNQVYVERSGKFEDASITFPNEREVVAWANSLLAASGWEPVGEGKFWTEGRLPDGSRVVVVVPPVAVNGPYVVIRKFATRPLTWEQLIEWGCVTQDILNFLKIVMQGRVNVLVSGGTSSGKTTLANLIVELVPPPERVVTVERKKEFRIFRDRIVSLEADAAASSGAGSLSMSDLLNLAAQMRPDRLVVGEFNGPEALSALNLMNQGHEGMVTLIHATSPRDALSRLETMVTMAEPSLTLPAVRAQIVSGLDLIVQQTRLQDGSRKIVSIVEVQDLKGDNIVLQELFVWEQTGMDENGHMVGRAKATGAIPSLDDKLAWAQLSFPKDMFKA